MPDWARATDRAHAATLRAFGEEVTHLPLGGAAETVRGIFRAAHEEVRLVDGLPVSTTRPVLFVRLSDLTVPPEASDSFQVRGIEYEVTDVQPDGNGGVHLSLIVPAN